MSDSNEVYDRLKDKNVTFLPLFVSDYREYIINTIRSNYTYHQFYVYENNK